MMLILRMFLSFGWRSWCSFLRTLNGIVVLYLHNSLAGVCGGIFTIGEIQPGANPLVGSASGESRILYCGNVHSQGNFPFFPCL